jgi:hypothetical protein
MVRKVNQVERKLDLYLTRYTKGYIPPDGQRAFEDAYTEKVSVPVGKRAEPLPAVMDVAQK